METPAHDPAMTAYIDQQIAHAFASVERIEKERTEAAYREVHRRDGSAWWHARSWKQVGLTCLAVIVLLVGVIVYLALQASQVQAFVQTVQMTEEGRLVQLGTPMDLLSYKPQNGQWMDMLTQWVRNYRWRVDETLNKHNWGWVQRHTCSTARDKLKRDEERLKPFEAKKKVSLALKSVTKIQEPESYQVVWEEYDATPGVTTTTPQAHTATFAVGRLRPKTMKDLLDNHLGQCVKSYDIFPPVQS